MTYEQIWLTGFMGTGKTRIARPLAAALDWRVADIDDLIAEEAGEPVRAIFEHGGEAAFRLIESRVVATVAETTGVVVATGGGTVLAESNRTLMKQRGFVVCLDASPQTIADESGTPGATSLERPLLAGGDPLARITEMKAARQAPTTRRTS